MSQLRDTRKDAFAKSLNANGDKLTFNLAFLSQLQARGQKSDTPDCFDIAVFENTFNIEQRERYAFFVGFAVDYICAASPLVWNESTKDGIDVSGYEQNNETAYVREFISVLSDLGFLSILTSILESATPADVQLDQLESSVVLSYKQDVPFTVKCDAFQQAVACINLHYDRINHPRMQIQDAIRLQ